MLEKTRGFGGRRGISCKPRSATAIKPLPPLRVYARACHPETFVMTKMINTFEIERLHETKKRIRNVEKVGLNDRLHSECNAVGKVCGTHAPKKEMIKGRLSEMSNDGIYIYIYR